MVAEMITRFSLLKRNLHLRNDRQILGSQKPAMKWCHKTPFLSGSHAKIQLKYVSVRHCNYEYKNKFCGVRAMED